MQWQNLANAVNVAVVSNPCVFIPRRTSNTSFSASVKCVVLIASHCGGSKSNGLVAKLSSTLSQLMC